MAYIEVLGAGALLLARPSPPLPTMNWVDAAAMVQNSGFNASTTPMSQGGYGHRRREKKKMNEFHLLVQTAATCCCRVPVRPAADTFPCNLLLRLHLQRRFGRLPTAAQNGTWCGSDDPCPVRDKVWNIGRNSAGLCV